MKKEIQKQGQEEQEPKKTAQKSKAEEQTLIRISATDIPSTMSIYAGLTRVKGISWTFSNAICKCLNLDKTRKVSTFSEPELEKIREFIKNPKLPGWLLNRRKDIETGLNKHLISVDLDLQREFDIRRMKKIKSYKGIRHAVGLPVRGQRTKAHFRKGRSVGVHRSKGKPAKKK